MGSKIIVLGPLPPPYGGVSIHIIRFLELVKAEGLQSEGHPYTGTTRQGKFGKLVEAVKMLGAIYKSVRPGREDTLHIHYGGFGYFLSLFPVLYRTQARKVITFHSVRIIQDLEGKPGWLRRNVLRMLESFDLFIPVRAGIGEELEKLGLNGPKTMVMPAFLPPADAERDIDRLPPHVAAKLLANQEAGRLQICAAAYYLGFGYGQEDLYGIEDLAKALALLDAEFSRQMDVWILVSNVPETENQKKSEAVINSIVLKLENINLEICYGLPLIPVMARCGAFLRPSREDGDSVAIREAMSMDLPVLASDVVSRPESVVTFKMAECEAMAVDLSAFLTDKEAVPANTAKAIAGGERDRFSSFVRTVVGQED